MLIPSFYEEKGLQKQGYRHIAGVDEAGRGPLAGPVVAAAVILPHNKKSGWLQQVRDSKQLSGIKREFLYDRITRTALATGIGVVSHQVIDEKGIVTATRLAMKEAIAGLSVHPDYLLIDHLLLSDLPLPQRGITNGDATCCSIACASIIAKVYRDRIMVEMDLSFPGYGLAKHKGYCTKDHIRNLKALGPSAIHRRTFRPVKELLEVTNEA